MQSKIQNPKSKIARRRAAVYLLVLITSVIVAVTGLTALTVARLERRAATESGQFAAARFAAQSALDYGTYLVAENADWRTRFAAGQLLGTRSLGDAAFTLSALDPADGDFSNWPYDPVVLTGVGAADPARFALQVTLEPQRTPLEILNTCLHAAGGITLKAGVTLTATGGVVSTSSTFTYNSATLAGSVNCLAAVGLLGTVTGSTTILSLAKPMPDPGVISMYAGAATPLSIGSNVISKTVIGPGYTPWGPTNVDGLYLINVSNGLTISETRIEGTLVVVAVGKPVIVDATVLMHNYRSDFPTLIVDGNLELTFTGSANGLSEASSSTNFNRAGVPYQGVTDGDTADTYPSELQGLIHATGTITFKGGAPRTRGVLISASPSLLAGVAVDVSSTLIHDDAVYDNPPLGYEATLEMRPGSGTWLQVAAP